MSRSFNEWQATQAQLEAVKRFERERSERVRLVLIEWDLKMKIKSDKKTKSK